MAPSSKRRLFSKKLTKARNIHIPITPFQVHAEEILGFLSCLLLMGKPRAVQPLPTRPKITVLCCTALQFSSTVPQVRKPVWDYQPSLSQPWAHDISCNYHYPEPKSCLEQIWTQYGRNQDRHHDMEGMHYSVCASHRTQRDVL